MPVFAKIGVPEIWRHERGRVRFYRLNSEGEYEDADRSVVRFVKRRSKVGENAVLGEFITWAKAAKLRQSN